MKRRVLTIVLAGATLGVLVFAAVDNAAGSPSMVRVTAAPRIPVGASAVGSMSASTSETASVVLLPRNEAALTRFTAEVTDSHSPLFHQYLARGEFRGRFGPTQATIDTVTSQLRASGLRVTGVSSDGLLVHVSGSAAQVERAFGTGLERVRLANGSAAQATTGAVRVPSTISADVAAVIGLNSVVRPQPVGLVRAPASARGSHAAAKAPAFTHPAGSPNACGDAQADAESSGGLSDDQIANAYGAFGLYGAGDLGSGQHVAIYELEPFMPSDVKTFDTCYFGASAAAQMAKRLNIIPVDGGQPTGPGSGEAILDVEDVSAVAPGATIDVYEGETPGGAGPSLRPRRPVRVDGRQRHRSDHQHQLGAVRAVRAARPARPAGGRERRVRAGRGAGTVDLQRRGRYRRRRLQRVPAAGTRVRTEPVVRDDPGSQPDVVAVGGTTIDDATQPPLEHVWNDGANGGGGGGGISMSWRCPPGSEDARVPGKVMPGGSDYTQANKVESEFGFPQNFCQSFLSGATSATPCRTLPDVSAQADEFTGAVTIYSAAFGPGSSGWITIGGTSSAAPIWAAMLALVNSSATCTGNALTRTGVGFVNPLLYAVRRIRLHTRRRSTTSRPAATTSTTSTTARSSRRRTAMTWRRAWDPRRLPRPVTRQDSRSTCAVTARVRAGRRLAT